MRTRIVPFCLGAALNCTAFAATHYVDLDNGSPTSPYTSWITAATNIQDAVDASIAGDEIVVTNGLYNTGGRAVGTNIIVNRVAVDKAVVLRSANGPAVTTIQGYQLPGTTNGDGAIRCVFLTNGASLFGFTLTGGATRTNGNNSLEQGGGGLCAASLSSIVSNCVIVGNSAAQLGGGCRSGNLYNCVLAGNSGSMGGGSCFSTLTDCALSNNVASSRGGGAYSGSLTNCVITANSAANGNPGSTASGGGAASCSVLFNCVLSRNYAEGGGGGIGDDSGFGSQRLYNCILSTNVATLGGGAWNARLMNCIVIGNRATVGGGAHCVPYGTSLTNCLIVGNVATGTGGGVNAGYPSILNNCTIVGNLAPRAGGINSTVSGTLVAVANNCIVYSNVATNGTNFLNGLYNFCCTTPSPANGIGNITNAPAFVDHATDDFRLQAASPCINAGNSSYLNADLDLVGNPRIAGDTMDIGAYEFQSPPSALSYAWAQQYGVPTDGAADFLDPDGDGMNNWQEWHCLTNPTNALSVLKLLTPVGDVSGVTVSWPSVTGRTYWLERATNLGASPAFSTIASNLAGVGYTKSYLDANAVGQHLFLYRVGVQ